MKDLIQDKKKMHYIPNYLLNPTHPVTITLIGCGGTGSHLLTVLAKMNHTLIKLGHPGFHVTVFDPDKVSPTNIGRQHFSAADIGLNKAVVFVTRINSFMGLDWRAEPRRYDGILSTNIYITCVDSLNTRFQLRDMIIRNKEGREYQKRYYWLDLGNTQHGGQGILGTIAHHKQPESEEFEVVEKLKCLTEFYDLSEVKDEDSGPSCSHHEALEKQDLLINSFIAQAGGKLLWRMFREGRTDWNGFALNLETLQMGPIMI